MVEKLSDERIAQIPNTLWGLAMVATYIGTHKEGLKSGVQSRLKTLGGELIVVSPKFKEFMEIVTKHQPAKEVVVKELHTP